MTQADRIQGDRTLTQHAVALAEQLAGTGLFAAPVEVGEDADVQTRLLALLGRHV